MEFAMEAPHSYGVFQEDVPVSSTIPFPVLSLYLSD